MALVMPDPVFMLSLFNESIREQRMLLHPWQIRFLRRYATGDGIDYTTGVNQMALVANNGSGKSQFCIAPASVWSSMAYEEACSVVTSSSGVQLDRQVGRSIRAICQEVNKYYDKPVWDIKYREYTYTDPDSGKQSVIYMYATDEAGKAEGYHPIGVGTMFSYFVDEAKSVSDPIYEGIERANGKSHYVLVSSPGQPLGMFYNAVTSGSWWTQKVTAYDCPHIKPAEIESAKERYGEHSALFRSMYLAEFTSVNEMVVLSYELITRQLREIKQGQIGVLNDGITRAGVDLSGGGDEQVVSVWQGNKQIGLDVARITDNRVLVSWLTGIFRKYPDLKANNINVDDGYTGRAIIDFLKDEGYATIPVRFGASAFNKVAYANRGTELWMNFQRHWPYLIPLADSVQTRQLASRYYKQSDSTGRIILESKREARANGHGSPDRGDATVLAFSGVPIGYFSGVEKAASSVDTIGDAERVWRTLVKNPALKLSEEQFSLAVDHYREMRQALASEAAAKQRGESLQIQNVVGSRRINLQMHSMLRRSRRGSDGRILHPGL